MRLGGGLYVGSQHFHVMTITDRRMPHGRLISVLSVAVWWVKLEKNDDSVRHNMTQIASLLLMATVFTRLMVCNVCIL